MALTRKRGPFDSSRILYLPVWEIHPNPNQPRTVFSVKGLEELSVSIQEHGILQPLTVRRLEDRSYELVSGERRLRAARMANLDTVPCILLRADDMESSLLALIENLQRRDLDFVDEALALEQLISTYHLSQEEAARKIGKSQSAVANKLRLLRLSVPVLEALRRNGLTERHGRALLRLPQELQGPVLEAVIDQKLTVSKTEELVERLLQPPRPDPEPSPPVQEPEPPDAPPEKRPARRRKPVLLVRDIRLFLNTIDHSMDVMRRSGISASCGREESDDAITLTIVIPKVSPK
ncbi:MAG: ParB/RepB/Spo0J family partition protein [Clostridiales bacterium]|nr:ParB/RepB/Spo0J family partition protein [Clostridiales bacterium]